MLCIEPADLEELGACESQVHKFRQIFGDEDVVVTPELVMRYKNDFEWAWAAYELFSEEPYEEHFMPLLEEADQAYEEAHNAARVEWEKIDDLERRAEKRLEDRIHINLIHNDALARAFCAVLEHV